MFIRCPKKAFSCLHHRMRWKKCHFHATAIGQRAMPCDRLKNLPLFFLILSPLNVQRVLLIFHPSPITHNSNSPIRTKLALSLECSRLDCFISAALFFCSLWSQPGRTTCSKSQRGEVKKKKRRRSLFATRDDMVMMSTELLLLLWFFR